MGRWNAGGAFHAAGWVFSRSAYVAMCAGRRGDGWSRCPAGTPRERPATPGKLTGGEAVAHRAPHGWHMGCSVHVTMLTRHENRVVARCLDGATLRGTTIDFSPTRRHFRLNDGRDTIEVDLAQLKALFFVKDFGGNAGYNDKKGFFARQNNGKKVIVEFKDGEVLFGYTLSHTSLGFGFFVFPGDPDSNNEKIFVVHASTQSVKLTPLTGTFPQVSHPG